MGGRYMFVSLRNFDAGRRSGLRQAAWSSSPAVARVLSPVSGRPPLLPNQIPSIDMYFDATAGHPSSSTNLVTCSLRRRPCSLQDYCTGERGLIPSFITVLSARYTSAVDTETDYSIGLGSILVIWNHPHDRHIYNVNLPSDITLQHID